MARKRVPPASRCSVKYRQYYCSLAAGHEGRHEAYFDDQPTTIDEVVRLYQQERRREDPPKPLWVVDAYRETRIPEGKPAGITNHNRRSHHLEHPGAWLPEAHIPIEDDEEEERFLAWEDMLPWERKAFAS